MRRRDFLELLGAGTVWPLGALAQAERVRRLGVLMSSAEESGEGRYLVDFRRGLEALGWSENRNLKIHVRWTANQPALIGPYAAEIVAQHPEALFANNTAMVEALTMLTSAIPLVFVQVPDANVNRFVGNL